MRIVFYTKSGFERNELFRYMFALVAARHPDCHIVAFRKRPQSGAPARIRKWKRKLARLGVLGAVEIITSYPLQRRFGEADRRRISAGIAALPRPTVDLRSYAAIEVDSLNGAVTAEVIRGLEPDVLIQAGAGILQSRIFSIPRGGTLNMHHGIAPLIRGMSSIQWALWERRPEWIGTTIHFIDEGIDTGRVLAYGKVEPNGPADEASRLFVEATRRGVEELLRVLDALASGREIVMSPAAGESCYRSTFSGWKMLLLRLRRLRSWANLDFQ